VPGERAAYRLHSESKTVSQVENFWADWDKMIKKLYGMPNLPPEIVHMRSKRQKTYWRLYTVLGAWELGFRSELHRPLRKIIVGPVPFSHRLLASLMYVDSFLHTSFNKYAVNLFKKLKAVSGKTF